MLSAFYGTDWKKVNGAAKKRLEVFVHKNKEAEVFTLGEENFSESELERHIASSGLFSGAHAVIVSNVLEHDEYGEMLTNKLEDLAASENLFIIKEGDLSAKLKKTIAKAAQESEEFVATQTIEKKPFQIFDLANNLGARDRKNLWLGYHKALRDGVAPEEIANILLWQVRTMIQVDAGATEGMKPFPLSKARGYLKNYSIKEVQNLSLALIALYHEARRGLVDFEEGLEKFILTI